MKIVDNFEEFFYQKERNKKCSWSNDYKGDLIRSDVRVHEICSWIIKKSINNQKTIKILDLAAGSGAFLHRIIDNLPSDINIDLTANDFENQITYKYKKLKITCEDINTVDSKFWSNKYGFYDVVLALELIEHLDYGYNLFKIFNNTLSNDGFALLSSPNNNSAVDRYNFMRYGHEIYFGERGYKSSGGHLQPCPEWLIKNYAERLKLKFNYTFIPLIESIRIITFLKSIFPFLLAKKNHRKGLNAAINIWLIYK